MRLENTALVITANYYGGRYALAEANNIKTPKETLASEQSNLASMEDSDHESVAVIGSSDDLLTEILIRLPVTSILRFKSVCKHWRFLLSHKHFTHRYDNLLKSPGLFARNIYIPFDVENRSPPPFRSLDFYFNRSGVRIWQSCNGLLLCSTYHNGAYSYHVFNPTTKQLAIIPSLPNNICSIALAFHQTHCVHYEVVCICDLEPVKNLCQIQVYSSDTKKWKICVKSFFVPKPIFFHPVVYWNRAVYWPPYYRNRKYLYFKIDDEQLQTLPLPEGLVCDDLLMYLGESSGHLHLILRKDHKPNILIMNVYEMLMDRSGWFVRYRVELDVFLGHFMLGILGLQLGLHKESCDNFQIKSYLVVPQIL